MACPHRCRPEGDPVTALITVLGWAAFAAACLAAWTVLGALAVRRAGRALAPVPARQVTEAGDMWGVAEAALTRLPPRTTLLACGCLYGDGWWSPCATAEAEQADEWLRQWAREDQ